MKTNSSKAVTSYVDFELRLQNNRIRSTKAFIASISKVFLNRGYNFLFNDLVNFYAAQASRSYRMGSSYKENGLHRNYIVVFTVNKDNLKLTLGFVDKERDVRVEFCIYCHYVQPFDLFSAIKSRYEHPTETLDFYNSFSSCLHISSIKFFNTLKYE